MDDDEHEVMDEQAPPDDLALRQAQHTLRLLPQIKRWGIALLTEGDFEQSVSLPQLALLHCIGAGMNSPVELARRQR